MEEQATNTKKRPAFITVLGILGFIGVAWQIIGGIMNILAGAVTSTITDAGSSMVDSMEGIEGMENVEGLQELGDTLNSFVPDFTTMGYVSIAAALVCLLGIIWMWQLKKKGFFVYVIGEIAAPIATIFLVGFGLGGMMATLGMIFPVVFIILWGLNLKHMS